MKSVIEQCGQIFEVGNVTLRCVLRAGHNGPHRATLNRQSEKVRTSTELEEEEVTLP